jgi:hypothetical protein
VTNSGVMLASGAGSVLEITDTAVVGGGGVVEIDNGLVRFQDTGNDETVDFLSGGSGGVQIDDDHSNVFAYIGTISGFGDAGHVNHAQYIDLRSVTFTSSGAFADDFVGNTLIVSSGGLIVAEINLAGSYSAADFRIMSGAGGTVEITDPTVPSAPQAHSANIALFGNYIANFAAEGHGALLVANTGGSVTLPTVLAHPQA